MAYLIIEAIPCESPPPLSSINGSTNPSPDASGRSLSGAVSGGEGDEGGAGEAGGAGEQSSDLVIIFGIGSSRGFFSRRFEPMEATI